MDRERRWHPIWVSRMAIHTIRWNANSLVIGVGCLIVICLVTAHTSVRRIVIITVVAFKTITGNGRVSPINDPVIIMDRECRWHPIRLSSVAGFTISWDSQSRMVWVDTRIIIRLMAADASIRCIVVATVVALHTVIGNGQMRPINDPIIVVDRKGCWHPIRLGGVAGFAVGW